MPFFSRHRLACIGLLLSVSLQAQPDYALIYQLKASVVKVHVSTAQGGHGVGTGVVVAPDIIATNCHILAHAASVNISKFGDSVSPVAMRADWTHDVCLLQFQYLQLPAVKLGVTEQLQYGQPVFSIGFPGGPPKPQTSAGTVRALYPLEDSQILRADAAFTMGASGSPVFNAQGELIAMSTFKSPGRHAYYYSVPVTWIQALMRADTDTSAPNVHAFWDQPGTQQPFFMQVVAPYQSADWPALEGVARKWTAAQPDTAEAHFYLASALHGQGKLAEAEAEYTRCTRLQARHLDAWQGLALLARQTDKIELLEQAKTAVLGLDRPTYDALINTLKTTENGTQ